jgi:hypothetical protein
MKENRPSKRAIERLRAEAERPELWERVKGFTGLTRPVAIRLTPTLAKRLNTLAMFHEAGSAEELAKRWLAERVDYELGLIEKARQQAG